MKTENRSQDGWVDLHLHTNISDGTLAPSEVVQLAVEGGFRAIAITDHDSVEGNPDAMSEGSRFGLEVIPGVEISAVFQPGSLHLLGYYLDLENSRIRDKLLRLVEARNQRNPKIIENLRALGIDINLEEVVALAGEGVVGRPHMARILIKKGVVKTEQEAFDKYLGKGKSAYAEKERMSIGEAIGIVRSAGGIAVLAHPAQLKVGEGHLRRLIREWIELGLEGIEVFSPAQAPQQTALYQRIAAEEKLLMTGGTDFHGSNKPDIQLGFGFGNIRVPYSMVVALKTRKGL